MKVNQLSVIVPVYNEEDNIAVLAVEIISTLAELTFEIIFVDDCSEDSTVKRLLELRTTISNVRIFRHRRNLGQTAAIVNGVKMARYMWAATLDGDCQNDPRDLLQLIDSVQQFHGYGILCMGQREQREDAWLRRVSSRVANNVRRYVLKDECLDSGCGLKLFSTKFFLSMPLFKNCHRFLPALFRRAGATIVYVPVTGRQRMFGVSKYGVRNRLWVGIVDLIGVYWILRRYIPNEAVKEVTTW